MCFSGLRENDIAKLRVQLMVYMFLAGPLLESVLRHCKQSTQPDLNNRDLSDKSAHNYNMYNLQ